MSILSSVFFWRGVCGWVLGAGEMGGLVGRTGRTRDGRDVARRFVRWATTERHVVYEAVVAA